MGRYALIIGTDQYSDQKLAQLKTPAADARAMAAVLADKKLGQFDKVLECINENEHEVRRAIAEFVDEKKPDDVVLMYFSGHGVQDSSGRLYLALKDTETKIVSATAIPAFFVVQQLDSCRSRKQLLILDCCHSGAFAFGGLKGGEEKAVTRATFEGEGSGRVVLTATDTTQFALEGDQVLENTEFSLFTHFLLQGLKTGDADKDRDGFVSVDEWYNYTYDRVRSTTTRQSPRKWNYGQEGDLLIAKSPVAKKAPPVRIDMGSMQNSAVVSGESNPVVKIANQASRQPEPLSPEWIAANKITLSNGMELMRVPAGEFWMGTKAGKLPDRLEPEEQMRIHQQQIVNKMKMPAGLSQSPSDILKDMREMQTGSREEGPSPDELPGHRANVPYDYWMARLPVTYRQYRAHGIVRPQPEDHPVTIVGWRDAVEWCSWLSSQYHHELPGDLVLRLPTEAEWEKAARGTDGSEYPWGSEFDKTRCNTSEGGQGKTTPVGSYSPRGDSPYGCADMAGNVLEWTHSLKKEYPYSASDGREAENASTWRDLRNTDDKERVLRGGCFMFNQKLARCAHRYWMHFTFDKAMFQYIGFRVVAAPKLG